MANTGDDFAPRNPAVPIAVSHDIAGGARLSRSRLGLVPHAARGSAPTVIDDRVLWANAYRDTDYMVRSRPGGFETLHFLRSPAVPESFRARLDLPPSAKVRDAAHGGGWAVVRGEEVLATISGLVAWDAQNAPVPVPVPVSASVVRGVLRFRVERRDRDVAYPLTIDPVVEDQQFWDRGVLKDQNGWAYRSRGAVFTNHVGWTGSGRFMTAYRGWHNHADEGTFYFQAPGNSQITEAHFNHMIGCYLGPGGACVITGVVNVQQWAWDNNGRRAATSTTTIWPSARTPATPTTPSRSRRRRGTRRPTRIGSPGAGIGRPTARARWAAPRWRSPTGTSRVSPR